MDNTRNFLMQSVSFILSLKSRTDSPAVLSTGRAGGGSVPKAGGGL